MTSMDRVANRSAEGAKIGAGEGNRTLVISLEGFCSTIELHPHFQYLSLNPSCRFICEIPARHELGCAGKIPLPRHIIIRSGEERQLPAAARTSRAVFKVRFGKCRSPLAVKVVPLGR